MEYLLKKELQKGHYVYLIICNNCIFQYIVYYAFYRRHILYFMTVFAIIIKKRYTQEINKEVYNFGVDIIYFLYNILLDTEINKKKKGLKTL